MVEPTSCVFCEIVRGAAPAHVVADSALSLAVLDINPLARGHCLVVPRRHVPWWHDLTSAETADLFELARRVASRIHETFLPDFVALYARGRRIPHTHLFLVPSFSGDPVDRHFHALEGWQEGVPALAQLRDAGVLRDVAAWLRLDGRG